MEKDRIIILSLIIAVVLTFGIMAKFAYYIGELRDEACKEIGFESFEYRGGQSYCEDTSGNLYYIKKECKLAGIHCIVNEITVGDMRTKYDVNVSGDEQ